jgi:hypothetical protein
MGSAAASDTAPRMPVHPTMGREQPADGGLALAHSAQQARRIGGREDPQESG